MYRRRRLLEAQRRTRRGPRSSSRRIRAQLVGRSRLRDRRAILVGDLRRPPARRTCGRRGARRAPLPGRRVDSGELRRQPLDLVRERRRGLLELRLGRDLLERPRLAGQLLVERGQRLLRGGVDEELRHLVQELVARRALDRPVGQPLAGLEDLLDPHALDPGLAQPFEVARAGSRARPDGRSRTPSTTPVARRARAPSRASPRTPRDPPSAPRRARRRRRSGGATPVRQSTSKNFARQSGSRQNGFSSRSPPCGSGRCRARRRARPAQSARNSSSPPSSSEIRVGSTTS